MAACHCGCGATTTPGKRFLSGHNNRMNMTLSDDQIREIRRKYLNSTMTQSELAKEYGVSTSWISVIVRMKKRTSAGI